MTTLDVLRALLGALGLFRPRAAARLWGADPRSRGVVLVARVLGGRHLAQAAVLTARPGPVSRTLSSAVDLLHAASMVALAVARPRLRRPALTSAGIAAALAAATLRPSLRRAPHAPAHDAGPDRTPRAPLGAPDPTSDSARDRSHDRARTARGG